MNALARWRTNLVFAVAGGAAFAGLLILASPPGPDEDHVAYGITMAVLSLPWLVATGVLWRAWWLRIGVRLSTLDAPARLLAMAVTTLPADRREWAAAMTAELTQIPLRGDRWRFAAGCARAAVFPPPGPSAPRGGGRGDRHGDGDRHRPRG